MADYTRKYVAGATYFFTVVTFERRRFLTTDLARECLRRAWHETRRSKPFDVEALCLLEDHLHVLLTLPSDDMDFSSRLRTLKSRFSRYYLRAGGFEGRRNASRIRTGERAVWQRRFWEHCIRDEQDFANHFDYIHFNPVKHGLVVWPEQWSYSTLRRYAKLGWYETDWGHIPPKNIENMKGLE